MTAKEAVNWKICVLETHYKSVTTRKGEEKNVLEVIGYNDRLKAGVLSVFDFPNGTEDVLNNMKMKIYDVKSPLFVKSNPTWMPQASTGARHFQLCADEDFPSPKTVEAAGLARLVSDTYVEMCGVLSGAMLEGGERKCWRATLTDKSGKVELVCWKRTAEALESKQFPSDAVVIVRGRTGAFQGNMQLQILAPEEIVLLEDETAAELVRAEAAQGKHLIKKGLPLLQVWPEEETAFLWTGAVKQICVPADGGIFFPFCESCDRFIEAATDECMWNEECKKGVRYNDVEVEVSGDGKRGGGRVLCNNSVAEALLGVSASRLQNDWLSTTKADQAKVDQILAGPKNQSFTWTLKRKEQSYFASEISEAKTMPVFMSNRRGGGPAVLPPARAGTGGASAGSSSKRASESMNPDKLNTADPATKRARSQLDDEEDTPQEEAESGIRRSMRRGVARGVLAD